MPSWLPGSSGFYFKYSNNVEFWIKIGHHRESRPLPSRPWPPGCSPLTFAKSLLHPVTRASEWLSQPVHPCTAALDHSSGLGLPTLDVCTWLRGAEFLGVFISWPHDLVAHGAVHVRRRQSSSDAQAPDQEPHWPSSQLGIVGRLNL